MPKRQLCCGMGAMVVFAVSLAAVLTAQEGAQPKHAIKQVMQDAHKGGLLKKVVSGEASNEDKLLLLDYYISLVENTPKKGDAAAWHTRTDKIILAAAKLVAGREGASAELEAATKCADCHKVHK